MTRFPMSLIFLSLLLVVVLAPVSADDALFTVNADAANPWHPHKEFPAWKTPQWVGDEGVEAVVILSIDDMQDTAKYEQYMRPILNRLKEIDGRAPLSIMTCKVKPGDPQLQVWLAEGGSIEAHTVDHPCPLLRDGDHARAKSTYDRCVDMLYEIPNNHPVAFRMPCCDSQNTVSPRFFSTIFGETTDKGHGLQVDSSVFMFYTSDDKSIPRDWIIDENGNERFLKYIPTGLKYGGVEHNHFVNRIDNYPYPYVINGNCWEFPCMAPSDWSAQHLHGPNEQQTLADWKTALDITLLKQGVMSLVFHPHGWIETNQIVELIDYAQQKYEKKVKFLNFREALQRLNHSLTSGQSLRNCDDATLARVSFRQKQRVVTFHASNLPAELQSELDHIKTACRFVDLNDDKLLDLIVASDGQTKIWLAEPGKQGWHRRLNVPADAQKQLLPIVRSDGTDNGFFVFDGHLCWQNEETASQNDLIQRVSIAELFGR